MRGEREREQRRRDSTLFGLEIPGFFLLNFPDSAMAMMTLRVICLLSLSLHIWGVTVTSFPGELVSLTCPLTSLREMLWYRQMDGQPPELLIKSFKNRRYFTYYSYIEEEEEIEEHRFTSKDNHTLIIKIIIKNDAGMYYCVAPTTERYIFFEGVNLVVRDKHWIHLIWLSSILGTILVLMTCVTICSLYKLKSLGKQPSDKCQNQRDMRSRASDPQVKEHRE
ncbi:uncharacterized protein LOC114641176 [Erpetoichthys calabaricus]|uniref:uncharacterized protein LOC114641176 n=1 Tax=Erpetoichthys calabaricus TaxID=27687 RepID=UPI0022343B10|nr:uncharacterized protein LOC114641176 [Erpetoichthys calabaricus]